jgi:signal transduction histidine kinase
LISQSRGLGDVYKRQGLAMVKQIIDNHNGLIYFEANQLQGTTFIVELPIVQA